MMSRPQADAVIRDLQAPRGMAAVRLGLEEQERDIREFVAKEHSDFIGECRAAVWASLAGLALWVAGSGAVYWWLFR